MTNDSLIGAEVISSAMERAEEAEKKLDRNFPSFVKLMIRSNVTAGFSLALPKFFCNSHLPQCDICVSLVDENNEEHITKYLLRRKGFSGGWKGFSAANNLQEGDAVIFHLVGSAKMEDEIMKAKMKVYIVRKNIVSAVDGALNLMYLQADTKVLNYNQKLVTEDLSSPVAENMLHDPVYNVGKRARRGVRRSINTEDHETEKITKVHHLTSFVNDINLWKKRSAIDADTYRAVHLVD